MGENRQNWLHAGRSEINNLTSKRPKKQKKGALESIDPLEKDRLMNHARTQGYQYIALSANVVSTISALPPLYSTLPPELVAARFLLDGSYSYVQSEGGP